MTDVKHDFRAKLQAKPGAVDEVYGPAGQEGLLKPIRETNGLLMPYTPSIQVMHTSVEYAQYNLPQTNFDYYAFARRASPSMSVVAPFTAQDQREARYLLAVIHFLRAVSLSYYGRENKQRRGIAPPTLLFSAYGPYMFERVPVLLRSVSFGLDADVDYVACSQGRQADQTNLPPSERERRGAERFNSTNYGDIETMVSQSYVPAQMAIMMELVYAPVPSSIRDNFDLNKFRSGKYLKGGNSDGSKGFI
jgi:hypothetical protein